MYAYNIEFDLKLYNYLQLLSITLESVRALPPLLINLSYFVKSREAKMNEARTKFEQNILHNHIFLYICNLLSQPRYNDKAHLER